MDYEELQEEEGIPTREGEKIVVLARQGREGTVIGRYADGRVILFADESSYKINPGDTIKGTVVKDARNFVIVEPEEVLGDTLEALMLNLTNVAEGGYYGHAVIAKGILYLMKKDLGE